MQKVDSFSMPPSVCFICTAAPSEPVCDTFLDFDPGVHTSRNGRIYVCASCAQTAADALGLFDAGKQRVEEAEAKVTASEKLLEAYAEIEKALDVVRPKVEAPAAPAEEKPKPKPKPKKQTGATSETLAPLTDPPPAE